MESLLGLVLIVVIYLVVRAAWRGGTTPTSRTETRDALARGAAPGVEVDPTLPRLDPSAVIPERIGRLREDAAFVEGVIFSNYLLPDEYREYLPGYRGREDLEEHAFQLGMDLEELEELAVIGDVDDMVDALHDDPDLIHDLIDDPYDAYDVYDDFGSESD